MGQSVEPAAPIQARRSHGRVLFKWGLVVGMLGVLAASFICISAYRRASEEANRRRCYRQFQCLGQAMFLYANENKGYLPSRLEDLILTQDVPGFIFVCPSSNDAPAKGNSLEEMAADFAKPGHHSYLRAPPVDRMKLESYMQPFILMYEPMENHSDGFHVVDNVGQVEFISGPNAAKVLAELRTGQNPPASWPVHSPKP
jgi:hypothetical protein